MVAVVMVELLLMVLVVLVVVLLLVVLLSHYCCAHTHAGEAHLYQSTLPASHPTNQTILSISAIFNTTNPDPQILCGDINSAVSVFGRFQHCVLTKAPILVVDTAQW